MNPEEYSNPNVEKAVSGRSLPFDVMQNAEHILLLYIGIYEPYGDADEDAKGIALHQMGYQPANLTQSKLLCIGPTQSKWRGLASYFGTGTDREKVCKFKYQFLYMHKLWTYSN